MPLAHGIDFHPLYQDHIDWPLVEPYPLMVIKFSQGTRGLGSRPYGWEDLAVQRYSTLRKRKQLELHRYIGGYHWLNPNEDVKTQLANCLRVVERVGGFQQGEFLQLDWETTHTSSGVQAPTGEMVSEFLTLYHDATGLEAMVYGSDWVPGFIDWRVENKDVPLWYANYNLSSRPTGGRAEVDLWHADIWQWTSTFVAPGFEDRVDMNEIQTWGFDTLDRICGYTTTGGPGTGLPVEPPPPPPPPPPPVEEPLMQFMPDLRKGARGNPVVTLQTLLIQHGIWSDKPQNRDGIFGDGTEKGVRSFQQSRAITVDGWVGKQTWNALAHSS